MFKYQLRSAGGMPGHKTKTEMQTQREIPIKATADTSGAAGHGIVKASRELSRMNNRLYRQSRSYDMQIDIIAGNLDSSSTYRYDFYTLPNTWFVHGAIKDAFNTYMQAHADELAQGVKFARWHDFAIDEQNPDGTWELTETVLYDGDGWASISAEESPVDSAVILNDGSTSKVFRLMGTDSGAFNIFTEFAKKLNYGTPDDGAVTSDQPYDGLLDLKDADNMAEKGDEPPYDRDFSSFLDDGTDDQNILVLRDSIAYDSNASGRQSTRVMSVPLGLVYVQKYKAGSLDDISNTVPELLLRFPSGSYKGVRSHTLV